MTLTTRILIGMAAGLLLGMLIQTAVSVDHVIHSVVVDGVAATGGDIFLRLLRMMVVPLVLVSLTCGAARLGATPSTTTLWIT